MNASIFYFLCSVLFWRFLLNLVLLSATLALAFCVASDILTKQLTSRHVRMSHWCVWMRHWRVKMSDWQVRMSHWRVKISQWGVGVFGSISTNSLSCSPISRCFILLFSLHSFFPPFFCVCSWTCFCTPPAIVILHTQRKESIELNMGILYWHSSCDCVITHLAALTLHCRHYWAIANSSETDLSSNKWTMLCDSIRSFPGHTKIINLAFWTQWNRCFNTFVNTLVT